MILQQLSALYDRLAADPERGADLPTLGFSKQNISYAVVLKPDGTLVAFDDIRVEVPKGKKTAMVSQKRMVLGGTKPSGSGLNPCFLWDNTGYLLGYKGSGEEKAEKRAQEAFAALRDKHLALETVLNHPQYAAVCRFLEAWDPACAPELFTNPDLLTGNGIFRIQGEEDYVHELPELRSWWLDGGEDLWKGADGKKAKDEGEQGMCLVTGRMAKIAVLHEPIIKGVANAQSMGAKLVSFNCNSFTSYAKEQSANAPVGEQAAFAYCNALNYLLGRQETRQLIGDSTTVFWADVPPAKMEMLESIVGRAISPPRDAMHAGNLSRVQEVLDKLAQGKLKKDDLDDAGAPFYILGLSPNVSRLSIRFWFESTFGELMEAVQRHYDALRLQPQWTEKNSKNPDPKLIAPNSILRETAREPKDIPPLFSAALMRSIIGGAPYPDAIAQAILRRISIDHDVNYIRCSYLKAWLLRKKSTETQSIITPMINKDNKEPGYLIGRLFAAYEKTQLDANRDRKLNRTIRDSFYSSASATPRGVMARLQRLYSHHLNQLDPGAKINREKLIQSIVGDLTAIPAHMSLEQQAQFTLGYYQQMQDFYTPKNDQEKTEQE